jgi:hypothetical protein
MSIPDLAILRDYVLTLDCGHQRRTATPCAVGRTLPCLNEAHHMEMRCVVRIRHLPSRRDVDSIGWLTPQAALLGAHDELEAEADALPWFSARRRKLRKDARTVGLAGALAGLRRQ